MLVVLAILTGVIGAWGKFQADTFSFSRTFQSSLLVNHDAERVVKTMATEIRAMSPSSNGAYAIESAATSSIVFFNDLDNDGSKERIRYFLNPAAKTISKGVVKPTGSPLAYNLGSEVVTLLLSNVRSTTTPIFDYYPSTYSGTTSPLTLPINILSVRMIHIVVTLDIDPNKAPVPLTVTTNAMIRNLKDNQ